MTTDNQPHSGHYFGESRNHWWNEDYVELLAKRAELQHVQVALDLGCGVGHWGRVLAPWLAADFRIFGIDCEVEWVEKAQAWVREHVSDPAVQEKFSYEAASAEKIPFADRTFDLVTCQTVLIHVSDPETVLAEMLRVLKPGGRVLVVEPNNLASQFAPLVALPDFHVEDVVTMMRFQMVCEQGKYALGLGYNSLGECLPGLFQRSDVSRLQVFQSDKSFSFSRNHPASDHEIVLDEMRKFDQEGIWLWPEDETKRYFLAGGGVADDFALYWEIAMDNQRKRTQALAQGILALSGTNATVVVIAEKHG